MKIKIGYTPMEIIWDLQKVNAPLKGKCFDNCMLAVLSQPETSKLQYVLGFVTPPGFDSEAHAWLQKDTIDGPVYLDPTLQDASKLWQQRKNEFFYDMRYRMTKEELLRWFRVTYADRTFSENGLPDGLARGPIINADGALV